MPKLQRSSSEDSPHRSGDSSEPSDPDERLKQLQQELDQHNHRILHLTAQRDALSVDINDLSEHVTQVKTTVTNYGAALTDLETRFHALEYFYEQKSKMILAAIGDKKAPIDELVLKFDQDIEHMKERLGELKKKQDAAQEESNEAVIVQADRQKHYDTVNNYQQNATNALTDMEGLRTQVTTADDNTDVASMYFLVQELHHKLHNTHITSQHELSLELRQQLAELEAAKEDARSKSAALGNVQNEYTEHQTTLANKRAGRRQTLLAEVQAMFPVSTSSAGIETPGATGGAGAQSSGGPTPAAPSRATAATASGSQGAAQKK